MPNHTLNWPKSYSVTKTIARIVWSVKHSTNEYFNHEILGRGYELVTNLGS